MFLLSVVLLNAHTAFALVEGPWTDPKASPELRAVSLMQNMTLEEKMSMLHGPSSGTCCQCKTSSTCAYVGNVAAISRLGIPPITMNDGPQGFRDDNHPGTTTAWPSGLAMAASWDVNAVYEWGAGMGKEFYDKGSNVQLGPGLCLARVPRNGRNFEYLSGEDPILGYNLVQPVIKGIQSQKVVANAKHWVLNNQETNRNSVSEEADERVRFEMYYPPFEGAIKAGVGSFMCSYNKVNGVWSCENPTTLKDLKDSLGFKGYVMSDWGATHSTSIMEGLDMEMPQASWMNPALISEGIAAGTVTEKAIDDAVTRILWAMFSVGVMDEHVSTWDWKNLDRNVTSEASKTTARRLSSNSTVLLKNGNDVLPLPQGKRLALLGFAGSNAIVHGGGSGKVIPSYVTTPLEGVVAAAGKGAEVVYNNGTDIAAAASIAASADYAIVFVGTLSSEGSDRSSLWLDDGCQVDAEGQCAGNAHHQDELVSKVAKANPKTIVVASVPGAVLMPWSGEVAAILTNFMPGQEAGHAIADVLFGKVNPSAKLPVTFPNEENEVQFTPGQWPGLPDPSQPAYAFYSEKLLVGYRYYDAHKINFTTGFPFGHGLSYTHFNYSNLTLKRSLEVEGEVEVTFSVVNAGKITGSEVVQLYLGFPADAGEPPLQLKGFSKTKLLSAGEKHDMSLLLSKRDLSIWNSDVHAWSQVVGTFRVAVGSSSRDIRLEGNIQVLPHEQLFV